MFLIQLIVGHTLSDRLLSKTSSKYAYVTKQMINLQLSMCVKCQEQRRTEREI